MRHLKLYEEVTGDITTQNRIRSGVASVNDMLTNYKKMGEDRKKWAKRYTNSNYEHAAWFKIASSVIDGKIKNAEIKDKVEAWVSKNDNESLSKRFG